MFPRLHIVTDSLDVVRGALSALALPTGAHPLALPTWGHHSAGPLAVQIRVKNSDRLAYELTMAALPLCREAGALCLVDDRIGVALAAGADGVHVGAEDLPVAAASRVLGPSAVLGATCRDPSSARAAVAAGASYVGVGPAFATSTKDGLPPPIGPAGIAAVVAAVPETPVIAIGGITPARAAALDSYGVAAVSAVAADPVSATADFLKVLVQR